MLGQESTKNVVTKPDGKVRVVAQPALSTWPACNAKKKFGIEVPACRTLKAGESVSIPVAVADKLIAAGLVKLEGGKS